MSANLLHGPERKVTQNRAFKTLLQGHGSEEFYIASASKDFAWPITSDFSSGEDCVIIAPDASRVEALKCDQPRRMLCEPDCTPLPPDCPSATVPGLEYVGRKFYHASASELPYFDAVDYCLNNGLVPARVDNEIDHDAVKKFLAEQSECLFET